MPAVWMLLSYMWLKKPYIGLGVRSTWKLIGVVWFLLLLFNFLGLYFIWWDVDQEGLTERRLFSKKTIPWADLVRIGPWNRLNTANRLYIEAEYHRSAPLSDSGKLLLRVKEDERRDLFRRLQDFAPQAEIEAF